MLIRYRRFTLYPGVSPHPSQKGFTLIELLVVIAIIGILATVIVASLGQARDKARTARTQSDLNQMRNIAVGAQINTNETLLEITGSANSYSSCPAATVLSSLAPTHACRADWETAIDTIASVYDTQQSAEILYSDAWGSPFLLDENEGELIGNPCRHDTVTSAGPDRIAFTGDDITIVLPFENC
ncbi:MAG: hypothetical protein CMM93_01415 [Rickettsiales bacterium]|mgnify:FL=1|nr:hypothetical protein [Rickettsiales bacterium]